MLPVVVHWLETEEPPPITFKFPLASICNVEVSYFNDKLLFVESVNGFWTVKLFCFVVNKLVICNCPFCENEFKLLNIVPTVEFILNTDNPEVVIFPITFNELCKVVFPEIANVFWNVDAPVIDKALNTVLLNIVVDVEFKLSIANFVFVEKLFKLLNIVVEVEFIF